MDDKIVKDKELSEIPSSQRRGVPMSLADIDEQENNRDMAIAKAYLGGGYSMKEIAEFYGVHYSTVSRAVKSARCKT